LYNIVKNRSLEGWVGGDIVGIGRRLGLLLALGALLVAGCAGPAQVAIRQEPRAVVEVRSGSEALTLPADVDPETVAELYDTGDITIIDVREDWEFAEGHIPGATLIPLGTLEDQADQIPTDEPVVLVCRSGNRSGQAYRYLTQNGFSNVSNMVGGMLAWERGGYETDQ
jgi:rhodanese-related sulfurtransferase